LEQIVLYLAVVVALSGFGMGLINLAGPFLKRRSIALPSLKLATLLRRGAQTENADDFDLELDAEEDLLAARDFTESSFAPENTLLARRRRIALGDDEEELDEELVEVLEEVAEEGDEASDDNDSEDDDEGPVIYTVSAETIGAIEDEEQPEEKDELFEDEDGDEDEDDEDEDEEEGAQTEVQTVAAGGGEGDDMMSFFGESADAGAGAIAAWREDLPEVSIEELLAEARAIRQQIQGKKSSAA
jgi:hypothetical protein